MILKEEKNVVSKRKKREKFPFLENILKIFRVLTDTHAKSSQTIFAYSFDSEHSLYFISF